MIVNKINSSQNKSQIRTNPNFKHGLTPEIVDYVRHMDKDEYRKIAERLWKKYGMFAHVAASNTVAFCLEKTADIMSKAGLKFPKAFSFESLPTGYYGMYDIDSVVYINSDKEEFLDLEKLDKMEESFARKGSSSKPNFLDTYLHEFMHSAHCENIMTLYGGNKGKEIFFDDLSVYSPDMTIRFPVYSLIKKLFPHSYEDIAKEVFSDYNFLFCTNNLAEYFAEKNTILISKKLGKDLNIENIDKSTTTQREGFPDNWDIKKEIQSLKKLKFMNTLKTGINLICLHKNGNNSVYRESIIKLLQDSLDNFDGEIWNGEIETIKEKSKFIENCATEKRKV